MPALSGSPKKERYERLAQGIAAGKTQEAAYMEAGFDTEAVKDCDLARREASRLLQRRPEIRERVRELREEKERRESVVADRALERAGISKSYVITRLHEIVERCMQHEPVLDREGNQVYVETPSGKLAPAYTFDAKNAKGALHLLGLEVGMFAHRVRLDQSPLDGLPAAVLQAMLENLTAMKQGRLIEHDNGNGADEPALLDRVASD